MLSVQRIVLNTDNIFTNFNTLYVVSSSRCCSSIWAFIRISIHYMLSVQLDALILNIRDINFNTLYVVSSITPPISKSNEPSFQYIICCQFKTEFGTGVIYNGLISIHYMLSVQSSCSVSCVWSFVFQYIICCQFNFFILPYHIFFYISIHYMLSVQLILSSYCFLLNYFNTLYVVSSKFFLCI